MKSQFRALRKTLRADGFRPVKKVGQLPEPWVNPFGQRVVVCVDKGRPRARAR